MSPFGTKYEGDVVLKEVDMGFRLTKEDRMAIVDPCGYNRLIHEKKKLESSEYFSKILKNATKRYLKKRNDRNRFI